jgi:hypothetical protein
LKAYRNISEKYSGWQQAFAASWSQYLGAIQKNSLTGIWAKDVAKYLIEEANKDD